MCKSFCNDIKSFALEKETKSCKLSIRFKNLIYVFSMKKVKVYLIKITLTENAVYL